MLLVSLHMIIRYLHIIEHALQLLRKLEPTLDFEFGQHASFCVI